MNNKRWDALYINATIVTCESTGEPYGLIKHGALAVKDGKIAWVGLMDDLPNSPLKKGGGGDFPVHSLNNQCITPALIDCHTHLVYAGNRAHEFEMRLNGATYEEIAKAGGGIRSTVMATRSASEDELLQQSLQRAKALLEEGVTTIEIKSGYGLDLETELKILRVTKKIGELLPITICPTFLGAHALPLEFQNHPDAYIDLVCQQMIPTVAQEKLATTVDVFCEKIAFNLAQTERVFATAQKFGLRVKCHAEQLSDLGSAALAARYNAISVDHLEFVNEKSIEKMSEADVTAVLLPGAFYFLREKQKPPVELLRQYEIPIAIATDCNPGTSPTTSLLLMLNMACTLFQLTPEEAFLGVTRNAARALGLENEKGSIKVGKQADFLIWDVQHPAELVYSIGKMAKVQRISFS